MIVKNVTSMTLFDIMIQLTNFHCVTIYKNVMIRKEVNGSIQLKVNIVFMIFQKRSFGAAFIKKRIGSLKLINVNRQQNITSKLSSL